MPYWLLGGGPTTRWVIIAKIIKTIESLIEIYFPLSADSNGGHGGGGGCSDGEDRVTGY